MDAQFCKSCGSSQQKLEGIMRELAHVMSEHEVCSSCSAQLLGCVAGFAISDVYGQVLKGGQNKMRSRLEVLGSVFVNLISSSSMRNDHEK